MKAGERVRDLKHGRYGVVVRMMDVDLALVRWEDGSKSAIFVQCLATLDAAVLA